MKNLTLPLIKKIGSIVDSNTTFKIANHILLVAIMCIMSASYRPNKVLLTQEVNNKALFNFLDEKEDEDLMERDGTDQPISEDFETAIKKMIIKENSYTFQKVEETFRPINISKTTSFSKEDFEEILVESVPSLFRQRAKKFVSIALTYAEKYQVDPFWVLAIMWTESHFDHRATSCVNATGLMQIMPATGHYLAKIMKKPVSFAKAQKLIQDPVVNIEMGVFYLSWLLKLFNNNHRYATVAYNMGPGFVKMRLRKKLGVGTKNLYLDKVRHAYKELTKLYIERVKYIPSIYQFTYVAEDRRELPVHKEIRPLEVQIPEDIASNEYSYKNNTSNSLIL